MIKLIKLNGTPTRIGSSPIVKLFRRKDFDRVNPVSWLCLISFFVFVVLVGFKSVRFLALGAGVIFFTFVLGIGIWIWKNIS